MDSEILSLAVAALILILVFGAGINVGVGLALAGVVGSAVFTGNWRTGLAIPLIQSLDVAGSYTLMVIPLFIAMGTLSGASRITVDLFTAYYRWMGRMPGGIAVATIGTSAALAALTGTSMAVSAAMSKIAMPELRRFGYDERLALGAIAMGGTLAIMIPPSVTLVIYAIFAQQSIGQQLIAGTLPGLLTAGLYMLYIIARCKANPRLGPVGPQFTLREKLRSLPAVLPFLGVVLMVIVGILSGICTPTEAAAVAVVLVLLICAWRRSLSITNLLVGMQDAVMVSASVLLVVVGSLTFSNFLALTGFNEQMTQWVIDANFSPPVLMILFVAIYLVLGCLMEATSILALTVPLAVPIVVAVGWDPVWFGVIVVSLMEVGAVTPPLGLNLFVVKASIPNTTLTDITIGSAPFWAMNLVAIFILYLFPSIATWLPDLMLKH